MLHPKDRPYAKSQIVRYFAQNGITGYEIDKVKSAFYFYGDGTLGETHLWPSTEVLVPRLLDLACEQWLKELSKLSGANNVN
jgi:hypothetical protein